MKKQQQIAIIITVLCILIFGANVNAQEQSIIYIDVVNNGENLEHDTQEFVEKLIVSLLKSGYDVKLNSDTTTTNLRIEFTSDENDNSFISIHVETPNELTQSPILYAQFGRSFVYEMDYWQQDESAILTLTTGLAFYSIERFDLAINQLKEANDIVIFRSDSYSVDQIEFISFYTANCYIGLSEFEHATYEYFSSVIEPELIPLYINSAWALLQLDTDWISRYGQNREYYLNNVMSLIQQMVFTTQNEPPEVVESLSRRAQLYALSFDYDSAIADMDAAIELAEENEFDNTSLAELYTIRGEIIFLIYEWDRVLDNFNAALELDPDYAPAYFQRGVLFYTMALREDALTDFETYIELAPEGQFAEEAQGYLESIPIEIDALGG